MNSPSAVSTTVPAREKAHAATAAATASTGSLRQPARAAASTAAAYAHGGAHASGQAMLSSPRAGAMIAKTFAPESGVKPFAIMKGLPRDGAGRAGAGGAGPRHCRVRG